MTLLGVVILLIAAIAALVSVWGNGSLITPQNPPGGQTTSTSAPPAPPYAVGTTSMNIIEPAASSGLAPRPLPTEVRYPAIGTPGLPDQNGAIPERAAGPYPLVVFSGGYDISPESYSGLMDAWAAAGYVVADPAYPFTTPTSPGGLNRQDLVNHPTDLTYVITSMLQAGSAAGSSLSGLIDPGEIALIGHSDGGDTSLALASNTCCHDARVKAVVLLSGAELAWFNGTYYSTLPVPMLAVQGTADDINPPPCSVQLYDQAPQPKYYLSMIGQSHKGPYLYAGQPQNIVAQVSIDFLNAYLKHSTSGTAAMIADGAVPGVATITGAQSVGPPTGSCPDAPPG